MKKLGWGLIGAFAATAVLSGETSVTNAAEPKVITTKPQKVGNGWARVYVALDAAVSGRSVSWRVTSTCSSRRTTPRSSNS